jgi:SAM-dependent methyltransferase
VVTESKQHWDRVYQDRSPVEVSWFQAEPSLSLQLIQDCALERNSAIIDIGGGASRLVDHLLDRGYGNLAVLDVSALALEQARQRLGARAADVEWFVEDVTRFRPSRKFDCWHDRAVFHFLTRSQDRRNYVRTLEQALLPAGVLIIATFAIGGPDKCSGLDVVQYDEEKIQQALGDGFVLENVKHELHVTPAGQEQKFIYFVCRKNA